MSQEKQALAGVKLVEEFMVDIFGCLIPGFFFITVLMISGIVPFALCAPTSFSKVAEFLFSVENGSFWWVMFLTFFIVSYVAGEIFIMGNVDVPDRKSISAEIRKKIREFNFEEGQRSAADSLVNNVKLIEEAIKEMKIPAGPESSLADACRRIQCSPLHSLDLNSRRDILIVLFPEDAERITQNAEHQDLEQCLSEESLQTIYYYRRKLNAVGYGSDDLLLYSFILMMQMDCGLGSPSNSKYPYKYYYKYLIYRKRYDLLPMADWWDKRSKQTTNKLKLEIKMFCAEGKALVDKNESHIRLMSSLWYGSYVLFLYTISCFAASVVAFLQMEHSSTAAILASFVPLLMTVVAALVHVYSAKHIHYQRIREIWSILAIKDQFSDIINYRKNLQAGKVKCESRTDEPIDSLHIHDHAQGCSNH